MHLNRTKPHRHVVPGLAVLLGKTPQLSTAIVLVDHDHVPAIFVDIKGATGIDMRSTWLQSCIHHPNAVQFVARQILVQVSRSQLIVVLEFRVGQPIRIVRNVHFFFADQLPFISISRTVEHAKIVVGTQSIRSSSGVVIGDIGRQPHTALAGIVGPRRTWLLCLVHCFVHQQNRSRKTCRRGRHLQIIENLVGFALLHGLGKVAVGQVVFVLKFHQCKIARRGDGGLRPVLRERITLVMKDMVPDRFIAIFRDWEWCSARTADYAVTASS